MATVVVAVLSFGLVGASHPAWASDDGKKVQVKAKATHEKAHVKARVAHEEVQVTFKVTHKKQKQYECVLKIGAAPHHASKSADHDGDADDTDHDGDADDAPTRTAPTPPGNLVVEIPPVTIARVHGKRLVVTTNTGQPPSRQDAVYYVAKGKGGVAPESIREQVLSGCAADGRR